jgi:DNA-binding beta-propeller fold protein YncE
VKRALFLLAILAVPASHAARQGGEPVALVTAETQSQLLAVGLPSGRIIRRLRMPADPENVEPGARIALVVSPDSGAVTLVDVQRLHVRKVLRGFGAPHIALHLPVPYSQFAYVTDDARGQLDVIRLSTGRVLKRIFVGFGAHHMSLSPDDRRLWIALGERARSIAVVDSTRPASPRLIGRVDPKGLAHDLAFDPDGSMVWVTYDDRSTIAVLSARTGRRLYSLPAGSPPQHIVFGEGRYAPYALVTSGNDGTLRIFGRRRRRTVRTLRTPPGSFNVAFDGSFILTSSLTRGTLSAFDFRGRGLLAKRLAPAARDVALVVLP